MDPDTGKIAGAGVGGAAIVGAIVAIFNRLLGRATERATREGAQADRAAKAEQVARETLERIEERCRTELAEKDEVIQKLREAWVAEKARCADCQGTKALEVAKLQARILFLEGENERLRARQVLQIEQEREREAP
jgi:uncharacterized protein YcfJ